MPPRSTIIDKRTFQRHIQEATNLIHVGRNPKTMIYDLRLIQEPTTRYVHHVSTALDFMEACLYNFLVLIYTYHRNHNREMKCKPLNNY